MATESSFDIVSKVNLQEVDNAINQTGKMILTRYDLKGTSCKVAFDKKENQIQIGAPDKMKHEAVSDILKERLASRGISLKSIEWSLPEQALDGSLHQNVKLKMGIPADTAKDLSKMIRDLKLKVQPQIQADQIRVTGKNKDDLQSVIQFLREKELTVPLQFINFR
ncbi:MAG: YajQ family cyclic di-GMP-binding protein [Chlamydiae bacterium]|nr:YajQ family cyclic di-GMP-binding protein [Chlamydiota bacterium]MBI3266096.1 YajQ family cyclic di-GMP-binding protein [Chlamydiota bacterium]